ncbi:RNA polymerase-associated protein rtf1 [Vanrija albida]|uniref:RNA polymerase-associated protein rtf1 n=1 Tax=Vanrija albida TaxID=181172 RepID=A0ABR3PVF9_9TREE
MSDLENELLGLAEDDPSHKRRHSNNGSRKPKSHAYAEESDNDTEASMDLDSDDDDGGRPSGSAAAAPRPRPASNPYPLEGKYVDEDDRDYLDNLPEIERENILASRQEEIQKFKDSMALDAMFRAANDDADYDDDDAPSRKRRKHTSVTTEASRAMAELKNRRKAKDERVQRRAARRERRARSSSIVSEGEASSEEGEISNRDWRQPSPSRPRPVGDDRRQDSPDLDSRPANAQELNSARLSRYELVDMMYKDQFESVITGAFVRVMTGEAGENGQPKYRIQRINGLESGHTHGRYSIEYKGNKVSDDRALLCQYGKLVRLFRIADVSNGDLDEEEFIRFTRTSQADEVTLPRRSQLKRKHEQIAALRDRPMTEEEVNRQVEARKRANPQAHRQKTMLEITSLMGSKNLALRRNDQKAVEMITRQIEELGGDPATGQLLGVDENMTEHEKRIRRINENNLRKTREAMAKAHEALLAKKKAEDAVVKAKAAAAAQTAAAESAPVAAPPVSGVRKGETPQQYVARTVDLDLGDF